MKKQKHTAPRPYRVVYKAGLSVLKSTQYYNVLHSSEAFDDIYYTFRKGKIHSKKITIFRIEEECRYTNKWESRMGKILEYIESKTEDIAKDIFNGKITGIEIAGGKIILRRK